MPRSQIKAAIICALLVLLVALSGCSALRLTYNNGPFLAWWWLDGYVDFSGEQTPRAKAAIEQFFDWARATQLADFATVVASAQAEVLEPTTPALACRWQQLLRDKLDPALERALQLGADLVPGFGEAQFKSLENQFAKKNIELRRDFLQPRTDERLKVSVKRVVERAEMLYGSIDDPQLVVIRAGVVASPFDAQAWIGERERWQQSTLQTLRRLVAEHADHDRVVAALRVLVEYAERSPDATYRVYQQKLADYNCAFAAQIHNATTPAQRQAARNRLKGWEDDLRALVAGR